MVKVPENLTAAERRAFRRISDAVIAAGLDADARRELIAGLAQAETELTGLRKRAKLAKDGAPLPLIRALHTAVAERRKLHREVFRGERRPPPPKSDPSPSADRWTAGATEANYRWATVFNHSFRDMIRPDVEPELRKRLGPPLNAEELTRRYGPPGWLPLVDGDLLVRKLLKTPLSQTPWADP